MDSFTVFLFMAFASFSAGLVDSMAGGGGLIQIPSLFSLFPSTSHATLFGTNKLSSIVGTSSAAFRFSRVVRLPKHIVIPSTVSAFLFAFLGAYTVSFIPTQPLSLFLPFLLLLVAIYTFKNKHLGVHHAPKLSASNELRLAAVVGGVIGFYDGFFGPGTGSFLVLAFVVWFGFDFLLSSALAKCVNVVCNLASLCWFVPTGHILWVLALWMALFNFLGSQIGTQFAVKKGAAFIRRVLLVVIFILICKTGYDAHHPFFI